MRELAQLFYDLEIPAYSFARIFEYKFDRVHTVQEEEDFFKEYHILSEDDSYSY